MDVLPDVQRELARVGLDGWLVYDFRGSNPVARPLLDPLLAGNLATRRVFLMIPATGRPTLLVHAIEHGTLRPDLEEVYGVTARRYSSTESLDAELRSLLAGMSRVAMEYSPGGDNPYVGTVDAGTIERIAGLEVEVVSSGDVAQVTELWTDEQLQQHLAAAEAVMAAKDAALAFIAERRRSGEPVSETQVQAVIGESFERGGFVYDHGVWRGEFKGLVFELRNHGTKVKPNWYYFGPNHDDGLAVGARIRDAAAAAVALVDSHWRKLGRPE